MRALPMLEPCIERATPTGYGERRTERHMAGELQRLDSLPPVQTSVFSMCVCVCWLNESIVRMADSCRRAGGVLILCSIKPTLVLGVRGVRLRRAYEYGH